MRINNALFTYAELSASYNEHLFIESGSPALTSSNRIVVSSVAKNTILLKNLSSSNNQAPSYNKLIQNYDNTRFGMWGYGQSSSAILDAYDSSSVDILGFHLIVDWKDLRPTSGAYVWQTMDGPINIFISRSMFVGFQVEVGNNAPDWVLSSSGVFYTTGGNVDGPWPYYFSTAYETQYFQLFQDIAAHVHAYSQSIKDKIQYWHVAEGSTGDINPYKGTPINSADTITDADWLTFRKDSWASASVANSINPTVKLLLNPGNSGEELDYINTNFPGTFIKTGDLSHKYSFYIESSYFKRAFKFATASYYNNRARGEGQSFYVNPYWLTASSQNTFQLIMSALAGGLDMFNMPDDWINNLKTGSLFDTRPNKFFTYYSGPRYGHHADRGFIGLKDSIDFCDETRFPTASYGVLVNPDSQSKYDVRINTINSNTDWSEEYKDFLRGNKLVDFFNPARFNAITAACSPLGAMWDSFASTDIQNGDCYHHDYCYSASKNWELFITQINPHNTSLPAYRYGNRFVDIDGRYGRKFNTTSSTKMMYFDVDDGLALNIGTNHVTMSVVYLDSGSGSWQFSCYGFTQSVQVGTTNTIKSASFDIPDFRFGNLHVSSSDFTLKYITGSNTIFSRIEFLNLSK